MTDEQEPDNITMPPTTRSIPRMVVGTLLIALTAGVVGLLVGTAIGGNWAEDFRFAGNRGYEATGVLGAIIGLAVGIVGGAIALAWLPRHNRPS